MSRIGLAAHSITIESLAGSIKQDEALRVAPSDFTVLNLSGIAASPQFNVDLNFLEPIPVPITASELAPAIGEWTAVAERINSLDPQAREYLVFNDEFGYSPIFYALIPGRGIVISDSFQGVSYELMRNGIKASLDIHAYATTVLTKDSRFSNPLAWQTAANEVHVLPPHYALHIDGDSITFLDRTQLVPITDYRFESLIDDGIEYISNTLVNLASNDHTIRSLLLSGGVDSRVVFALILASGAEQAYELRSNDPRLYKSKSKYSYKVFEDDFFISHAIGNHFGVKWNSPRSAFNLRTSLAEGLQISQSISSNFSYSFPATTHHPVYATPEISLRGGGGEPIKDAGFLSLIPQVKNNSVRIGSTDESPFDQFKQWFLQNAVVDHSKSFHIDSSLNEIQPWLETTSFDALMPSYYQHSRNRTHFGHGKFSIGTNLFPFQPLSNSFFYLATRKQESSALRENIIAKRVFELTEPSLLEFPFESAEATKLLTRGNGRSIQKDSETLNSHFQRLAEQKPTFKEVKFAGSYKEEFLGDKNSALLSMCRSIAIDIEEFFHSIRQELKSIHKSIFDALELGILSPNQTVARMMSARDIFMPTSPTGQNISYQTSPLESSNLQIKGLSAHDLLPSLKTPALSVSPPVVLAPKVNVTETEILVEANPQASRPASLEFAFYILVHGRAFVRGSYQENSSAKLDMPADTEQSAITIKCFARHKGATAPCFITTVEI